MEYTKARKLYFHKRLYFHKKSREERTKKILRDIAKTNPTTLLDVGCGVGFNTFEMANQFCFVVGSDISEEVYTGNEYKDETKTQNIKFVRCNTKRLPFKDRSFDVVNASQTLEHISDVDAAIKELKRVSKKHVFVDVPTILWEIYYYTFAIWWWGITHPIYVASKLIKKIKAQSVTTGATQMCIGDHVNKFGAAKWVDLFQKNGLKVQDCRKICGKSILLIHGVRTD